MSASSFVWGLLFICTGVSIAFWGPGTPPAIGMVALTVSLGVTVILVGNALWFLRRTTKPDDYVGNCPVGESCQACGAFNYKPRRKCRSCRGPVNASEGS